MTGVEIAIVSVGVLIGIAVLYWSYLYYTKVPSSHYEMTDKDIMLFAHNQPDKMVSAEILSDNTALTKAEARNRLSLLNHRGILDKATSSRYPMQTHYSLKQPITDIEPPDLSSDPFLSMEDLMRLFKHHNYRVSIHDICMATNLPTNIIVREMKYFEKKKVVTAVTQAYTPDGMTTISSHKFYVLRGEYRNDPEAYLKEQEKFDLDLSKIYETHKNSSNS